MCSKAEVKKKQSCEILEYLDSAFLVERRSVCYIELSQQLGLSSFDEGQRVLAEYLESHGGIVEGLYFVSGLLKEDIIMMNRESAGNFIHCQKQQHLHGRGHVVKIIGESLIPNLAENFEKIYSFHLYSLIPSMSKKVKNDHEGVGGDTSIVGYGWSGNCWRQDLCNVIAVDYCLSSDHTEDHDLGSAAATTTSTNTSTTFKIEEETDDEKIVLDNNIDEKKKPKSTFIDNNNNNQRRQLQHHRHPAGSENNKTMFFSTRIIDHPSNTNNSINKKRINRLIEEEEEDDADEEDDVVVIDYNYINDNEECLINNNNISASSNKIKKFVHVVDEKGYKVLKEVVDDQDVDIDSKKVAMKIVDTNTAATATASTTTTTTTTATTITGGKHHQQEHNNPVIKLTSNKINTLSSKKVGPKQSGLSQFFMNKKQ